MLVLGFPQLLIPLAAPGWRIAAFAVGMAFFSFSAVVYNVAQVSYRQAICPPRLLGRMNAAIRWVVWGTIPLGACSAACSARWPGCAPRCGSPTSAAGRPAGGCSSPRSAASAT